MKVWDITPEMGAEEDTHEERLMVIDLVLREAKAGHVESQMTPHGTEFACHDGGNGKLFRVRFDEMKISRGELGFLQVLELNGFQVVPSPCPPRREMIGGFAPSPKC
jgi:hypothetical protein